MEVIVGEADVSRAANVRRQINKLIATTNEAQFDLAYLLYEAKTKNYYTGWGFESYAKYAKSLKVKSSRAFYLVRIIENMKAAGLERPEFEPVGLSKLRLINQLKPESEYKGTPMPLLIRELTLKAIDMSLEEVQHEIDTILGLTEDESMCWMNLKVKTLARENVIKPALALAKKHMPESQTKDADGNFIDPSDGAALEMICANFLADPNYAVPIETTPLPPDEIAKEEAAAEIDADQEYTDLIDETEIPTQELLIPSDETIAKIAALGQSIYKK